MKTQIDKSFLIRRTFLAWEKAVLIFDLSYSTDGTVSENWTIHLNGKTYSAGLSNSSLIGEKAHALSVFKWLRRFSITKTSLNAEGPFFRGLTATLRLKHPFLSLESKFLLEHIWLSSVGNERLEHTEFFVGAGRWTWCDLYKTGCSGVRNSISAACLIF